MAEATKQQREREHLEAHHQVNYISAPLLLAPFDFSQALESHQKELYLQQ